MLKRIGVISALTAFTAIAALGQRLPPKSSLPETAPATLPIAPPTGVEILRHVGLKGYTSFSLNGWRIVFNGTWSNDPATEECEVEVKNDERVVNYLIKKQQLTLPDKTEEVRMRIWKLIDEDITDLPSPPIPRNP